MDFLSITKLQAFCQLAHDRVLAFYGYRDSCVFSTATVCDVLHSLGLAAFPLRVEAAVFLVDSPLPGCILGSLGDGTRLPAAEPGMWHGHLVSLVESRWLLDTTLDQVGDDYPYLGRRQTWRWI